MNGAITVGVFGGVGEGVLLRCRLSVSLSFDHQQVRVQLAVRDDYRWFGFLVQGKING